MSDESRLAVGVDVGGTTIAAGVVDDGGRVLADLQRPTHGGVGAETTIVELVERVTAAAGLDVARVAGIGVGVPALVDAGRGVVGPEAPHVPELAGRPLAEIVATRFGVPAFVDNDVNALALAEWQFGAGRGTQSLVVLAAGTGFGSGIVLDGVLVRGAHGLGAEFGHTPVKFDGRPCWCGGRGCLAVYASGRGVAEAARERVAADRDSALLRDAGGDAARITAAMVFAAAERGEPVAAAVVDEACRALGATIAVVVNGLNPEVVVITGGVAASYARLERRVLAAAADHALSRAIAATRVVIVPGDKRVTVRGAAALVFYELARAGTAGAPHAWRPS
ncbi:MAG: ROK family protein [Candidatus Rokubacteria bacterium]|nr:ROK family protein [Candidatus Rokubacteria bacterium]